MARIRIERNFGVAPTSLLNNPEISFKAKGLFTFMNGKPDDWDFSIASIASQNKEGKDAIRAAILELEEFGYLARIKSKDSKGFFEYEYVLSDVPMSKESDGGKSHTGKPDDNKRKSITKKDNTNTPIGSKSKKQKTEFIPPTLEEVEAFFIEKGHSKAYAKKAFDHYEMGNPPWTDSHGTPVRAWKQKMNTNWVGKPENISVKEPTARFEIPVPHNPRNTPAPAQNERRTRN